MREIRASPTPDGVTRTMGPQPLKSDHGKEGYITPIFGAQTLSYALSGVVRR